MLVNVYRNLSPQYRKQRAWSVMAHEGPQKGRVLDVVDGVILRAVCLVVRESGRQRVLREQSKNVHAFIRGQHRAGHRCESPAGRFWLHERSRGAVEPDRLRREDGV